MSHEDFLWGRSGSSSGSGGGMRGLRCKCASEWHGMRGDSRPACILTCQACSLWSDIGPLGHSRTSPCLAPFSPPTWEDEFHYT